MMQTVNVQAIPLPQDDYHGPAGYGRDSHSSLQLFRESVAEYAGIRVFRTMQPQPSTPEMTFGSAFHSLILEPEAFRERYCQAPKFDRRFKEQKAAALAWEGEHVGMTPLSDADWRTLHAMREGLLANPLAKAAIEADGPVEHRRDWDDPDTGCPLKSRHDKLLESKSLTLNLKTTTNRGLRDWGKTCHGSGYHKQDALYLESLLHTTGGEVFEALAIAVSKDPPHETACFILDDAAVRLGHEENAATLRELAERRATNNWTSRWHEGILTVSLPVWATRK